MVTGQHGVAGEAAVQHVVLECNVETEHVQIPILHVLEIIVMVIQETIDYVSMQFALVILYMYFLY
jgi:hypothetical protein